MPSIKNKSNKSSRRKGTTPTSKKSTRAEKEPGNSPLNNRRTLVLVGGVGVLALIGIIYAIVSSGSSSQGSDLDTRSIHTNISDLHEKNWEAGKMIDEECILPSYFKDGKLISLEEACTCAFKESKLECMKNLKSSDPVTQEKLNNHYEAEAAHQAGQECDQPSCEDERRDHEGACYTHCFHKATNPCEELKDLGECYKQTCPEYGTEHVFNIQGPKIGPSANPSSKILNVKGSKNDTFGFDCDDHE